MKAIPFFLVAVMFALDARADAFCWYREGKTTNGHYQRKDYFTEIKPVNRNMDTFRSEFRDYLAAQYAVKAYSIASIQCDTDAADGYSTLQQRFDRRTGPEPDIEKIVTNF